MVARYVLQGVDGEGFASSLIEADTLDDLLPVVHGVRHQVAIRVWDRIRQAEVSLGICDTCDAQPCQCAHHKEPGWLARLELELKEAA